MKKLLLVTIFATAGLVVPALAQQDDTAQGDRNAATTAVAATEEAEKEKVVCKVEKATGSLIRRKKTCMTESEWEEFRRQTYQGVNDRVRNANGAPSCNPGGGSPCY